MVLLDSVVNLWFLTSWKCNTILEGAYSQLTIPDIVEETEVDVALPNLRLSHLICMRLKHEINISLYNLRKDQILSTENLTGRGHTGEGG